MIRKEISQIAQDYDADKRDRKAIDHDDQESAGEKKPPKVAELKEEDRAMMKASRKTEDSK